MSDDRPLANRPVLAAAPADEGAAAAQRHKPMDGHEEISEVSLVDEPPSNVAESKDVARPSPDTTRTGRPRMTLRIPDDEVARPSTRAASPDSVQPAPTIVVEEPEPNR